MTPPAAFAGQTVETARRALAARLRQAGIDPAELDARLLTGAALGLDLTGLIAATKRIVTADEAAYLEKFLQRRVAGEPVARILGVKEFWGLTLQLSPATLVPRPDTETVVELALEACRRQHHGHEQRTHRRHRHRVGRDPACITIRASGAIGVGTDISLEALQTARDNAAQLGSLRARHSLPATTRRRWRGRST